MDKKTLQTIAIVLYFIGLLIFVMTSTLQFFPEASKLPISEYYARLAIIDGVALLFVLEATVITIVSIFS